MFLLISSSSYAGDYVFHTGETITGRRKSCGKACSQRQDALKIDRTTYNSLTRWHKVVNGAVVEMSQAEKDSILQAEADAQEQALLDAIDEYNISKIDLITALVKRINVRIPNNPITKQEVVDQIKTDLGL